MNVSKHNNDYLLREFLITDTASKKSRKVFQFQYLAWSGMGSFKKESSVYIYFLMMHFLNFFQIMEFQKINQTH